MDSLTHRTGIDAQGRKIHGDAPEPTQAERHENRMLRAAATIKRSLAPSVAPMEFITADGRRGWPRIVEYAVHRGGRSAQEYAPTMEPVPPAEREVGYEAVVHDLAAYERLKARGLLEIGHRLPPGAPAEVVDNRTAPGT